MFFVNSTIRSGLRILVIRFSSIGDLILISPILRALYNQKNAQTDLLVKEKFGFVYEKCPYLKNQIYFNNNLFKAIREVRRGEYDYIIDLQNNYKSRLITFFSGLKTFRLDKINTRKWLAVTTKNKSWLPPLHIVDRMFDAVKHLEVVNDRKGLDYFIPDEFKKPLEHYGLMRPYVALVSGGSYFTKQIPVEIIDKILQKFSAETFVLLGDASDEERTKVLKADNVINLCGKLHFHESAWLIKNAAVVITSDTGLMHAAAAFKKKIFSLWGNTIPEFGMYPYFPGEGSRILEVINLSCRPCSKLGFSRCPRGHFHCMTKQDLRKITL